MDGRATARGPPPQGIEIAAALCALHSQGTGAPLWTRVHDPGELPPTFFSNCFFLGVGLHCADIAQVHTRFVIFLSQPSSTTTTLLMFPHSKQHIVNWGHQWPRPTPVFGRFQANIETRLVAPVLPASRSARVPPASIDRHPHLLAQARRLRRSNYTRRAVAVTPCPGARCLATVNGSRKGSCAER